MLPIWMVQAMVYDIGYPYWGTRQATPPRGYVPFAEEVAVLRASRSWQDPPL